MSFLNAVKIKLGLNASATDNFVLESTGQGSGQIRKGDLATTGNTLMNWNSGGVNGIAFAPTQVPSSDPNTLDDYEEGTWTATVTGFSTTVTTTFSYVKVGKLVTMVTDNYTISGTSNSVNKTITGLPSFLFPSISSISVPIAARDNGSAIVASVMNIGADGSINVYSTCNGTGFTASGACKIVIFPFSYSL